MNGPRGQGPLVERLRRDPGRGEADRRSPRTRAPPSQRGSWHPCLRVAVRIADFLVEIQHACGGLRLEGPPDSHLDHSAEIATWLLEISAELG